MFRMKCWFYSPLMNIRYVKYGVVKWRASDASSCLESQVNPKVKIIVSGPPDSVIIGYWAPPIHAF